MSKKELWNLEIIPLDRQRAPEDIRHQ